MNDMLKNLVLWLVIAFVLMFVFGDSFKTAQKPPEKLAYSEFMDKVKAGEVKKVTVEERNITGETQDGKRFATYNPPLSDSTLGTLLDKGVAVRAKAPDQPSLLMNIFVSWFPIILFIGVWIFFMRQMQGRRRWPRRYVLW